MDERVTQRPADAAPSASRISIARGSTRARLHERAIALTTISLSNVSVCQIEDMLGLRGRYGHPLEGIDLLTRPKLSDRVWGGLVVRAGCIRGAFSRRALGQYGP
jgi:hypothetical protein